MSQSLTCSLTSDQTLIAREVPSQRILEIALRAPLSAVRAQRPRLNLALVLDRSGSMSGEKLEYVKRAAQHVLDLMTEQDRVSLVIFDDEIDILAPSQPVTDQNRRDLKARLQSVRSGGSTNLSGGWLAGCQEVARAQVDGELNRALLLTDGQANVGITHPNELAKHARELADRGVSTSTFGVGEGFNEHLLEEMSNQGRGNFYYIGTPSQIPGLFEQEFTELSSTTAREVVITVELPPHTGVEVLGGWRHENRGGQVKIYPGSLYSGRTQEIYLKLLTPPTAGQDALEIRVSAQAVGDGGETLQADASLRFTYASQVESEREPKQVEVMRRYAEVDIANTANDALILERAGKREEAARQLTLAIQANAPYLDPERSAEYNQMTDRLKRGLDERDRKSAHQAAYDQKRRRTR